MTAVLFAGDKYDPTGGAGDMVGRYDSVEAAVAALADHPPSQFESGWGCAWAHILDVGPAAIVARWETVWSMDEAERSVWKRVSDE